ncbi:MAG: hypothetical protein WC655_23380, partial [Candidatus Hydrogenedentales bacterium]
FLADGYPDSRTIVEPAVLKRAAAKNLRVYIEYPQALPGMEFGASQPTEWERIVTAGDAFGEPLPALRLLTANGCVLLPATAPKPWLVAARVAGYDTAVFGLPEKTYPVLFEIPEEKWLVATTKLSGFVTGRFAPTADWKTVWETILNTLTQGSPVTLSWTPDVRPAYAAEESLPSDFEKAAFDRSAQWFHQSRLLVGASRAPEIRDLLLNKIDTTATPAASVSSGDGSMGMIEGYASAIAWNGTQLQRTPLRADCHAEAAMTLAFDWRLNQQDRSRAVATNLLDFVYSPSGMCVGGRANPKHPAYGLVSWGIISPLWEVANYGDDNARVILATAAASAALKTDRWDEPLLRALLANLRTTGTKGFRGDRIDMPNLESFGWRFYYDRPKMNVSPHFECNLWACYLWAYHHTRYAPFLERTKIAMQVTMEGYPEEWLWRNTSERAKMMMPLAWLVRVDDTPEHRAWLKRITDDVIALVQPCGAVVERADKPSDWSWSKSNEEYGTTEASLIQVNGDPASDQLYTTPFALMGLHEAYAVTGDEAIKAAEDKVAEYLCRIQSRSEKYPYLSGAWLRAFDFKRWDYWSASGDVGWGAWCIESGWGNAWTGALLALRNQNTSLWDITQSSTIRSKMKVVLKQMSKNMGGPWKKD